MTEFLTVKEVAELLRIKERKVYDLAAKGALPCSKAIGKLLFPRDEIRQWIAAGSDFTNQAKIMVRPNVFLGSHDPLLDWAIRESRCAMATLFDSSSDGLKRFKNGEGLATGLHLPNRHDEGWNIEAVGGPFAAAPVVLVHWAKRTRGIALAEGVSLPNNSLADLKDLTVVPRQEGAGTQVFFEKLLAEAGLQAADFTFCEPARSELDLVECVAGNIAQAGFSLESIAAGHKLNFIPVRDEHFDLLVERRAWFEPPFQQLLAFTRTGRFIKKAEELKGYDISNLGGVLFKGA